jgi:YjbE family integral membrane protein
LVLLHQHWQFILSLLSIVVVDLTLSGDNAVVIAAAAKSLAPHLRKRALIAGAACAVIALVTAAFFIVHLLHVKFLQIVGGIAILWIALNLFREEPPLKSSAGNVAGFWRAMWFIIVADVTMSTDNILAVGALAQGNLPLLLIGLGISIPLVVFASGLLAALMDRYIVIVYIGAALLGRVAGNMIMTDAFIAERFAPTAVVRYSAEAVGTIGVLAAGWWVKARSRKAQV